MQCQYSCSSNDSSCIGYYRCPAIHTLGGLLPYSGWRRCIRNGYVDVNPWICTNLCFIRTRRNGGSREAKRKSWLSYIPPTYWFFFFLKQWRRIRKQVPSWISVAKINLCSSDHWQTDNVVTDIRQMFAFSTTKINVSYLVFICAEWMTQLLLWVRLIISILEWIFLMKLSPFNDIV